jgi:hypothetical protein
MALVALVAAVKSKGLRRERCGWGSVTPNLVCDVFPETLMNASNCLLSCSAAVCLLFLSNDSAVSKEAGRRWDPGCTIALEEERG